MLRLDKSSGLLFIDVELPYKNQNIYEAPIPFVFDTGAAGVSEGYLIKLPRIKCLGFEINDFEIACHDLDSKLGIAGLLGMNFLKHFRMDISFDKGLLNKITKTK